MIYLTNSSITVLFTELLQKIKKFITAVFVRLNLTNILYKMESRNLDMKVTVEI